MDLTKFLGSPAAESIGFSGIKSIGRFALAGGNLIEYATSEGFASNNENDAANDFVIVKRVKIKNGLRAIAGSCSHIANALFASRNSLEMLKKFDNRRWMIIREPSRSIGIVCVGKEEGIFVEFYTFQEENLNVLEKISATVAAESQEVLDLGGYDTDQVVL